MSAPLRATAPVIAAQPMPPPVAAPSSRRPWWKSLLHALPNLVVFAMLGGVFYLGHHTGWKMPKMSQLMGSNAAGTDDWCAEHLVPESACIECQVDLLPKGKSFGFCQKHGVAECVIEHPELAQVKGDPQLPKYDTVRAIALVARPENNSRNTLHTTRVQFASKESVEKAGVDVNVVQEHPMTETIAANGELTFDPTRVAHLATRVPGTVSLVLKTVGDEVAAGDVLALVDAAQVGQAKSQLLQAIVELQRQKKAVDRLRPIAGEAVAKRSLIEAESALQEAEVRFLSGRQALANLGFVVPDQLENADAKQVADDLRFLGIPKSATSQLPASTKTANLIAVLAPHDGVVVSSEVVAGEVVDASDKLFTIADPTRMWLLLNVRQEDAKYVRLGLPVAFQTSDGQKIDGSVSWISPAVNEQSRSLQVRVILDNAQRKLQDKTFGAGRITLREEPNAIVVPKEAVQSTPDASFVFVRDKHYFDENSPKFFHVRQVRIGAKDGQYVELLAGVLPGEVVATKGSNVLLAQLLRSNLGAGCGCHEH